MVWPPQKPKVKQNAKGLAETKEKDEKPVYLNGQHRGQRQSGERRRKKYIDNGNGNGNGNGKKQGEEQHGAYILAQGGRLLSLTKEDVGGVAKDMKDSVWRGAGAVVKAPSPRMPKGVAFIH